MMSIRRLMLVAMAGLFTLAPFTARAAPAMCGCHDLRELCAKLGGKAEAFPSHGLYCVINGQSADSVASLSYRMQEVPKDCDMFNKKMASNLGKLVTQKQAQCKLPPADAATLKQHVTTCGAGLKLLKDNMYAYPAKINAPNGTKKAWTEVWGSFTKDSQAACGAIGKFIMDRRDHPALADAVARLKAEPGDWMNDKGGIAFLGNRITQYCPNLHKSQLDCVATTNALVAKIPSFEKLFEILNKP